MGLPDSKWGHNYCGTYTRFSERGGQFYVPISHELKQMETKPQNIENYLKALGLPISISLHQECHISCQFTYHGCFPTIIEKAEMLCISPILSYSRSSEKSSSRYSHDNSNNSNLTKQNLYPKIMQINISNPILIFRMDKILLNPETQRDVV